MAIEYLLLAGVAAVAGGVLFWGARFLILSFWRGVLFALLLPVP